MIFELNHVGIVIRDLDASLSFYQGLLGARVVYRGFIPASRTDVVYLQIAGGLLELLHRAEPPATETFGMTHLAFLTDDLDADYARLVGQGHAGLVAPKAAGSGVGRLAFVGDPNGARIELIQRDLPMRDGVIDHPIVKSFDHYSLRADDLDAALGFYQGAFGLKTLKILSVPATNLSIHYLHYGYDVLELLHRPAPDRTAPLFGHYALRVDDVDQALGYFAEHGVPAEPGTPKPAGTGIGRIGLIRDPDGVRIELVDRPDLRAL